VAIAIVVAGIQIGAVRTGVIVRAVHHVVAVGSGAPRLPIGDVCSDAVRIVAVGFVQRVAADQLRELVIGIESECLAWLKCLSQMAEVPVPDGDSPDGDSLVPVPDGDRHRSRVPGVAEVPVPDG
jgi:hypothetical protein